MGCFSFNCKESGKPAWSSSFDGDAVRIFLLKGGKVIEEMQGHYDSYGRVFDKNGESFEWKLEWGEVCDLMFSNSSADGLALVLEKHWQGNTPTTQSEDDPNQGWGKKNGGKVKIDEPVHLVYNEQGEVIFSRTDATKELEAVSSAKEIETETEPKVQLPKPLL